MLISKRCRYLFNSWESRLSLEIFSWFKKNTAVLFSYPKSGRTWLKFMLAKYLMLLRGDDHDLDFRYLNVVVPNLSFLYSWKNIFPIGPTFLGSTHSTSQRVGQFHKLILLLRDPRDVLVSFFFHQKAREIFSGDLKDFIFDSPYGLHAQIRYLNFWARRVNSGSRCHVMRYEDLKASVEEEMENAIRFLDVPFDSRIMKEAIAYGRFDHMKRIEDEKGNLDDSPDRIQTLNDELRFVRKGRTKAYKDYLQADEIMRINRALSSELIQSFEYDFSGDDGGA